MPRVIAVSDDPLRLEAQESLLQAGGHMVVTAQNMKELLEHLSREKCDVVKIGSTIAAAEKRRILNTVRHYYPACRVIEVYQSAPDLPDADAHIQYEDQPQMLLPLIDQLTAG